MEWLWSVEVSIITLGWKVGLYSVVDGVPRVTNEAVIGVQGARILKNCVRVSFPDRH